MDDAARDTIRGDAAVQGLAPAAVAHLAKDALSRIELDHLAPVKGLLKKFFSDADWTQHDDIALAELVGPGEGWWRYELGDGFAFSFGWHDGAFRLELTQTEITEVPIDEERARAAPPIADEALDGTVVAEMTPNPRTVRFVIGDTQTRPSRWYESAAQVDDPRVARLFSEFDDVANVLVGPDFVAVGIHRPDRWETLLTPMLHVIEAEFATTSTEDDLPRRSTAGGEHPPIELRDPSLTTRETALDRAWRELRALKLDRQDDRDRLVAAASSPDVATRQVAARLLLDIDPEVANRLWADLLNDASRTVRRATVDAMVDADRPALAPLLEHALADPDAWTRWKALHGLVELGLEPSRAVLQKLEADTDYRVRIEATNALRRRDQT